MQTKKGRYIRLLENPTYACVASVIVTSFYTPYERYQLEDYPHSGIHFSQMDFDALQQKQAIWYMAYRYEEPIGCVAIVPISNKHWRIHKLAVLPDYRGRGLGKLLLWHAERHAFTEGAKKISLCCLGDDTPLMRFYARLGYRLIKEKTYKKTSHRMAFLEKGMAHLVDHVGEAVRAFQLPIVKEQLIPRGEVEVVLLYHPEEVIKQSNTGHVLQRVLPAHVSEILWHRNTLDLQLSHLSPDFETVLLYPSKEAMPIADYRREQRLRNDKPLRLITIDATWQQAQKMMGQSPGLHLLPHVKLVDLPKSRYALRKNQKSEGLCTLEAVAEAFKELGYHEASDKCIEVFMSWMAQSGKIKSAVKKTLTSD